MRTLLPVTGLLAAQACYVYTPLYGGAPASGGRYAFEITDQGRVGLSDRLGAGVTKVEGTLVGREGDAYLVSISGVETIGAGTSHWGGERVSIPESDVGGIQQRTFSRGRTWAAIGAASIAVGAFILTRNLFGSGAGGQQTTTPPPPGGGT